MRIWFALAALMACGHLQGAGAAPGAQSQPGLPRFAVSGAAEAVLETQAGCDAQDYPDAPARAFRQQDGRISLYASHFTTRRAEGASLDRLTRSCAVVMASPGNAEPARYLDKRWIASTWTENGKDVYALVHHEFQANRHPGACAFAEYRRCWYNTIIEAHSTDGGATFFYGGAPRVVAAPPFRQEIGQGRHRGFFNPSNIFADGEHLYVFMHTTGWPGQGYGSCLFRARRGEKLEWLAWNGRDFAVPFGDPYAAGADESVRCKTVAPFSTPVGSVTRLRTADGWIAVFQRGKRPDAPAGFYQSWSKDLLTWSAPTLLYEAATLFDSPCDQKSLVAYPSLLDPQSKARNFDDVGHDAWLTFSTMAIKDCRITNQRRLERVLLRLEGGR